jgi:hypothetical protein
MSKNIIFVLMYHRHKLFDLIHYKSFKIQNLNFRNSFNYFRSYVSFYLSHFTHGSAFFAIIRCVKIVCEIAALHIHSSVVLQPFVGPWTLLQFCNPIHTVGRTPWTGDQPVARPLLTHRIDAHRHSCLKLDSKPRPQCVRAG